MPGVPGAVQEACPGTGGGPGRPSAPSRCPPRSLPRRGAGGRRGRGAALPPPLPPPPWGARRRGRPGAGAEPGAPQVPYPRRDRASLSPSRAFSPRPPGMGVLPAPASRTGHPAPLRAPSPVPAIPPPSRGRALPDPRTAHPPPAPAAPLIPSPGVVRVLFSAQCGGEGMEGAGASLERAPHPPGGFGMGTRVVLGWGCVPLSQGRRDNGGRFVLPLDHGPHSVAMRCPSRGEEGLSGANSELQTSGK